MMAGTEEKGDCVYDRKSKKWIEKNFESSPRADFEWECLDSGKEGVTRFILDLGSQLSMLKIYLLLNALKIVFTQWLVQTGKQLG